MARTNTTAEEFGHRYSIQAFDVDGVMVFNEEAETWRPLVMAATMNPLYVTIQIVDRVKRTNRKAEKEEVGGQVVRGNVCGRGCAPEENIFPDSFASVHNKESEQ